MNTLYGKTYKVKLSSGEEMRVSFIAKRTVRLIEKKLMQGEWNNFLIPVILVPWNNDYWIRFVSPSRQLVILTKGWE